MFALSGNSTADFVVGLLLLAWSGWRLKWIVGHILINVVVAWMVSIATGQFLMAKMWEFLYKKLLPFVGIYVVVNFVSYVFGESSYPWASGLITMTWVSIEAMLTADLADNLEKVALRLKIITTPVLPAFMRKNAHPIP